jgi:aminobenzoyl-glutamate utilization protein B
MRIVKLIVVGTFAAGTMLLAQGRGGGAGGAAQTPPLTLPADTQRITDLKTEAAAEVEKMKDFSQQMVDQLFSYGELGFQEFETSKYLVNVLKQNGFRVEEGVAGIPTSFIATWGTASLSSRWDRTSTAFRSPHRRRASRTTNR